VSYRTVTDLAPNTNEKSYSKNKKTTAKEKLNKSFVHLWLIS